MTTHTTFRFFIHDYAWIPHENGKVSIGRVVGIRIGDDRKTRYLIDVAKPPSVDHREFSDEQLIKIEPPYGLDFV